MRKSAWFALLATGVLSACSASPSAETTITAQVPTTVVVTASSVNTRPSSSEVLTAATATATSSRQAATSSAEAALSIVPLGSTQNIANEAKVTAFAVDREVPAPEYDNDKSARTALDVQVCLSVQAPGGVSSDPWTLTDDKGGRYKPDLVMDPKLPEYPYNSTSVAIGECIRGWIMMKVPESVVITGVRYGLQDGTVLRWSVKP